MVYAELVRCERLIQAMMASGGLERPRIREYYQDALDLLANAVEYVDDHRLVQLESTAMELDWSVYEMTQPVVQRLLDEGRERKNIHDLSGSMFCSGSSKLSKFQHDLVLWFRKHFQLDVIEKDVLLKNVDKAVVALRWLSFRCAIRKNSAPLASLTQAISEASSTNSNSKRKRGSDEFREAEKFHYDLVELLCVHAASGQPGIDLKRLKRAESDGEDISAVIKGRRNKSNDPDVVFDEKPSEGFAGLVALVNRMCELNELALERLRFETDDGVVLEVVVGEELLYCGRNSVVLSCRRCDQERATTVLKVQPECDSLREEDFHNGLDRLPGIRRKVSAGRVLGAGTSLRFIQLAGFGSPFSPTHMSGDNAREVAQSACETLESVHQAAVLHRDVKPSNFIVVDGRLLLNDFDLSCEMDERIQRCLPVGTSLFRSPRWDASNPKGVEYEMVDDWLSLGLTLTYLTGAHRCKASKLAALKSVASADWAPAILRHRVAAGLESS